MARPDCWNFAMDFLGSPEKEQIEEYVERLEEQLQSEAAANFYLMSKQSETDLAARLAEAERLLREVLPCIGPHGDSAYDIPDRIEAFLRPADSAAAVDPKPWVARTWAGARVITETRFAEAWEAQDFLAKAGATQRVSIDHEPRAAVSASAVKCETCGYDLTSEHGPKFPYSCPECTPRGP